MSTEATTTTQSRRQHLTQRTCETARPDAGYQRLEISDTQCPGLKLRVTGQPFVRSFSVRYTVRLNERDNRQKRAHLGRVGSITLTDARKRAVDIVHAARHGADVLAEEHEEARRLAEQRTAAVAAANTRLSLNTCWERFLQTDAATLSNANNAKRRVSWWCRHIAGVIGERPIEDIARADVSAAVGAIPAPTVRAKVLGYVRQAFSYAHNEGIIAVDLIEGMKSTVRQKPRERVLDHDEIKAVWSAAAASPWPFGDVIRAGLLTGLRRENIVAMEWDWIGDDGITIPAASTKSNKPYFVSITGALRDVLDRARDRSKSDRFVFSVTGRAFTGIDKSLPALHEASGTAGWTMHDLRRTARTELSAIGVLEEVAEAFVHHTRQGVVGIYNRHSYKTEVADAAERLARHLLTIAGEIEPATDTVVALRG